MAAKIRGLRPPDPYKNKGVRYTGERLKKKVGKAAAAAGVQARQAKNKLSVLSLRDRRSLAESPKRMTLTSGDF